MNKRKRPVKSIMVALLAVLAFLVPGAAAADYWDEVIRDRATIAAMQEALRAEGYAPGPADGTLNRSTVLALKQAQEDRELEPTGRPDRRTVAALGIDVEA